MALGAGPAHAMYFTCYEYLKEKLTPYSTNSYVPESAVHAIAGASATVLHDGIMTPAEGEEKTILAIVSDNLFQWSNKECRCVAVHTSPP